jgi:glycosyltransferase involved in cell wall biosynthesis
MRTADRRGVSEGIVKLNIALLHPAFLGVGGAEILALSQAKCLLGQGFNVRVITRIVDESRWREEMNGMQIALLGGPDWLEALGGREAWITRRAERLSKLLSDIDVAIAHNYPMPRVLANAASRARKVWYCNEPYREIHLDAAHPTLSSRRSAGIQAQTMAESHFARMVRRQRRWPLGTQHRFAAEGTRDLKTVNELDLLCANSGYARELAMRTYGSRPCKVLYPIVRFPADNSSRRGLDRGELRVLVQTRLVPEKNVDTVLRGFARFTHGGRYRGQLHIVGEGPSRPALETLARQLGIVATTQFHGFVSDFELRRIYGSCQVFALLSIDEPFGMVFPEAAARGLLLVGPDHGGPAEILDGGKLGYVTDAFSADGFAEALERIAKLSDQDADALRTTADRACRERYCASTIGPQMRSAYELD